MINRRIIRGKVMQQIYAYGICKQANIQLSKEHIMDIFQPDLNSLEPQDANKLEGYAKLTLLHFEEYLRSLINNNDEELPKEVVVAYNKAIIFLNQSNEKDFQHILKKNIEECENIYNHYLMLLNLLPLVGKLYFEVKKNNSIHNNIFVQALENSTQLQSETIKRNLTWENDHDLISDIVSHAIKDDILFQYQLAASNEIQKEREFAIYFLRNIVLKNPRVDDYFNLLDYNWEDNKAAIKDMASDTIKAIKPNEEVQLSTLSKNWDDDKLFLKTLFTECVHNDRIAEEYMIPHLKNWEVSRLTATDSIMMKMCISEMIHFSGIPTKVSINEYVEMSKKFSGPKSKLIINGVLDAVSDDLIQKGIIKKSARGLIDTK